MCDHNHYEVPSHSHLAFKKVASTNSTSSRSDGLLAPAVSVEQLDPSLFVDGLAIRAIETFLKVEGQLASSSDRQAIFRKAVKLHQLAKPHVYGTGSKVIVDYEQVRRILEE